MGVVRQQLHHDQCSQHKSRQSLLRSRGMSCRRGGERLRGRKARPYTLSSPNSRPSPRCTSGESRNSCRESGPRDQRSRGGGGSSSAHGRPSPPALHVDTSNYTLLSTAFRPNCQGNKTTDIVTTVLVKTQKLCNKLEIPGHIIPWLVGLLAMSVVYNLCSGTRPRSKT